MKVFIKLSAVLVIVFATTVFLYFQYLHNIIHVDYVEESTGRLNTIDKTGNIKFTQKFKLRNYGFKTIKLNMITASCGCTKIECQKEIKPFSSVNLIATVEYPASILEGKLVDIAVESSAKNSSFMLKSISEAGNYFSYSPTIVELGRFYKSKTKSYQIEIRVSTPEKQIPKIEITNTPNNLKYEIFERDKRFVKFSDGSTSRFTTFTLDVETLPCEENASFNEELDITIHGEKDYKIQIPIMWKILPNSEFMLGSYYFSSVQKDVPIILNYDGSKNKIKDITVSNTDFKITKQKAFNDGMEFLVSYNGAPDKNSSGTLTVTFENDNNPAITNLNYILR